MKLLLLIASVMLLFQFANAELKANPAGGFTSTQITTLPGEAGEIYDAMTGDILPWWDHTFSDEPMRLTLEAWPGGRFIEEFDDAGNGALHATVIYAQRPKMIRFQGPLGLSGRALNLVVTYEFSQTGDSTQVKVTTEMEGQIDEEWANIVDGVWKHFLIEAFQPYIESEKYKSREKTKK